MSDTQPPGPSWTRMPRLVSQMLEDELVAFESLVLEYGDILKFPFKPGMSAYIVCRPEWVQQVLQDKHRIYEKAPTYDALRPVLGNGLLLSSGDYWLRQRRLVAPMFHRKAIEHYLDTMVSYTNEMLDEWEGRDPDEIVDVSAEMMKLTLGIAGEVLFSRDVRHEASDIGDALNLVMREAIERIINPLKAPLAVPTPTNLKVRKSMAVLEEIVQGLIDERRGHESDFSDLLTMLMTAEDADTGETMTDVQIRDEVMTFILAGHETTSNALSWAWYSLSLHPAVRRRLEEEVDAAFDDAPTLETLGELTYTEMVFDETTRLYPPAWTVERTPTEDDVIGGYTIPAGSIVMTAPYFVHRNPRVWENPLGFDPERFAPGAGESRHRFAHFPFGGGPRMCPGADFAVMESKVVLSMVARRFRLEGVPGARVKPEGSITLRPRWGHPERTGLPMHLRAR